MSEVMRVLIQLNQHSWCQEGWLPKAPMQCLHPLLGRLLCSLLLGELSPLRLSEGDKSTQSTRKSTLEHSEKPKPMSTTQTGAFKIDGGPRHPRWEPPRSPPLEPLQLQANRFSQSTVSVVFLFREGIQSSMRATGTHNQVCPALFPCASSLSLHNFSWWIADLTGFTWSSFHLLGMHLFHLPKGWKGQPHYSLLLRQSKLFVNSSNSGRGNFRLKRFKAKLVWDQDQQPHLLSVDPITTNAPWYLNLINIMLIAFIILKAF